MVRAKWAKVLAFKLAFQEERSEEEAASSAANQWMGFSNETTVEKLIASSKLITWKKGRGVRPNLNEPP